MPQGKDVRYRVVTRGGKKLRLAFAGKEVVEVKRLGVPPLERRG